MLRKTTLLGLGALTLLCTACAGRPQTQVAAIVQPMDQQKDCLALSAARGEYFTLADSGDSMSPSYLRTLLDASGPTGVGLVDVVQDVAVTTRDIVTCEPEQVGAVSPLDFLP